MDPLPLPPHAIQLSRKSMIAASAKRARRGLPRPALTSKMAHKRIKAMSQDCGGRPRKRSTVGGVRLGGEEDFAAVLTLTTAVMGVTPSSVTVAGEAVHVAFDGNLPQLKVTVPVKPLCGVTVTL